MHDDAEAAIMLTLAAISYRGYNLLNYLSEDFRNPRLRAAMAESLNTLGPVKGHWDLVWGPASYHHSEVGLDEVVMFVARNREKPTLFVVAIRGTNPISIRDWISGNFIINKTVQWPYGTNHAGAEISCSTAFDLSVLQHLQAASYDRSRPPQIHEQPEEPPEHLSLTEVIKNLGDHLRAIGQNSEHLKLANACGRLLAGRMDPITLLDDSKPHSSSATGIDIRQFFKNEIQRPGQQPIDIYVTGHSKGGSLSSTFALWLADTQGEEPVLVEDRWDPKRRATVYAYSFAGPTAGNEKFADHSDAVIGDRCWRYFNEHDVVPLAWADLEEIPDIYGSTGLEHLALAGACENAIKFVEPIGYRQLSKNPRPFKSPLIGTLYIFGFVEQAVHQHLQAYLDYLIPGLKVATFFTPVL